MTETTPTNSGLEVSSEPVSDLSRADAGPLRPTPSWGAINPDARSGQEVILCGKTSGIVCAGRFVPQEHRKADWPMGCDWFFLGYGLDGSVLGITAGLWMPLPAAPDGAERVHAQADGSSGSEQKTLQTERRRVRELGAVIDAFNRAGFALDKAQETGVGVRQAAENYVAATERLGALSEPVTTSPNPYPGSEEL